MSEPMEAAAGTLAGSFSNVANNEAN